MSDAELSGAAPTPERAPDEPTPQGGQEQDKPQGGAEAKGAGDPRIAELESRLAAARAEAERMREDYLRARADTDNVRRRSQEEISKAHKFGIEDFASALLAVKDSLDAALKVEKATVESFREGVDITARQLDAAFEKNGIRAIDPQGEKFDPHRHQAISQVDSPEAPNTVVTVLQKGYLIHERVLRPALVVVSKAAG